jgi:hypothetical protein
MTLRATVEIFQPASTTLGSALFEEISSHNGEVRNVK